MFLDDELVEIRRPLWMHEANAIASVLEGNGIEAWVPDAFTLGVRPELGLALGGARVLVRRTDMRRAEDVLAAIVPDVDSSDPDAKLDS